MIRQDEGPARVKLIAAFASIYVIWGSTYLAILYAIETIPPFLMAGSRFLLAGAALYIWARMRGAERPNLLNWRAATIVGGLLLLGGNGAVVWAEQRVATGLAALLITTVPIWMMLLEWMRRGGAKPGKRVIAGLILGFAGLVLLIDPIKVMGSDQIDPIGAMVLICGSFCWASGSIYSRRAQLPASPLLATAMEMLMGGALLILAGLLTGQVASFKPANLSLVSILSVGYLIIFGSIIAFTAYIWLLRVSTPARVSTYAYVNPLVAVFLGWAFASEPLTSRMFLAATIIVTAVGLITTYQRQSSKEEEEIPEIEISKCQAR